MSPTANKPTSRHWRRLIMLVTAFAVGAVGWTLLGEAESRDETADQGVVARIEGVEVTRDDLQREVSAELAALEAARRRLLSDALEHRVREVLIELEAGRRGLERDELLALEVDARLDEVSPTAVRAYLEAHRRPLDDPDWARRARRALRTEALVRELKRRAKVDVLQSPEA